MDLKFLAVGSTVFMWASLFMGTLNQGTLVAAITFLTVALFSKKER